MVWPIPTNQRRSAKEMDWQIGQGKKQPSQKEYKRKTLLQSKYASLSLSSWTNQHTAYKRENRPMKQELKRTQKAGS
jgi:hypothetical protein